LPHECGARVVVGILKIDDVRSEYTVDLELFLDWIDPALKSSASQMSIVALPELPADVYRPHIMVPNANKLEKTMEDYFVNPKIGAMFVHFNWTVTIREPLELGRFPFDRQILKYYFESNNVIFTKSKLDKKHYPLVWPVSFEDNWDPAYVKVYSALPHWNLVEGQSLRTWQFGSSHSIEGKIRIERRFNYYFYNVILPLFLLVGASLSVCFLDPANMSERTSISVTFFLALVAFKYVLTSLLPHISYLTWLDSYVLLCFSILSLGVAENIVVRLLFINNLITKMTTIDYIYAASVGGLWVLGHAIMVFCWKMSMFRETWQNVEAQDDKGRQERKTTKDMEIQGDDSDKNKYTLADYYVIFGTNDKVDDAV